MKEIIIQVHNEIYLRKNHYEAFGYFYKNKNTYDKIKSGASISNSLGSEVLNQKFIITEKQWMQMKINAIILHYNISYKNNYMGSAKLKRWMVKKLGDSDNDPEYFV